jgi:phospholipase/carboxylesterase
MGKNTRDVLLKAGYSVEWREYPMQHSVCLEEVRDIGTWLTRVLARARSQ